MEMTKIAELARGLYEAHGNRAEAEAAKKATRLEEAGEMDAAETWHAVRKAVCELRGAPES